MKIFVNQNIKLLFRNIVFSILIFTIISALFLKFNAKNASLYIIIFALCMSAVILLLCYGYFKEQHRVMQSAIVQIKEYIYGNKEISIECNDEGELYRLFHEVNTLVSILNTHAENEESAKKFLRNTISDISHQLKIPLAALNIYNGIMQDEAKAYPAVPTAGKTLEQQDRLLLHPA